MTWVKGWLKKRATCASLESACSCEGSRCLGAAGAGSAARGRIGDRLSPSCLFAPLTVDTPTYMTKGT